jgi:hypothetical protein
MKFIFILLSLNIIVFSDMSIITSKQNNLESIEAETLSNIYLKKIISVNNEKVTPVDNIDDYNEFYKKVVKKTPQQIHSYWMKEIFTGKKRPPKKVPDEELEQVLHDDSSVIGYSSQANKIDTKVIYEVK